MAIEKNTLARPYAKAAFEYAQAEKALPAWTDFLNAATFITQDKNMQAVLTNPEIKDAQLLEIYQACLPTLTENQTNFLKLLIANQRLAVLPEIAGLYSTYRDALEKTVHVEVRSFADVATDQQVRLKEVLTKKLNRSVALSIETDPALIGGAIITAGDLVIDGSVRGKLQKMARELVAN